MVSSTNNQQPNGKADPIGSETRALRAVSPVAYGVGDCTKLYGFPVGRRKTDNMRAGEPTTNNQQLTTNN